MKGRLHGMLGATEVLVASTNALCSDKIEVKIGRVGRQFETWLHDAVNCGRQCVLATDGYCSR